MKLSSTIIILLLLAATATAVAQPRLEIIGGNTCNWDTVAPAILKRIVEVRNAGGAELVITAVRSSCGCLTAVIDRDSLKPGEIARISISFDVRSRVGHTTKTISITSNDPANSTQILYMKAFVRRAITIIPASYVLVNDAVVGVESAGSPIRLVNTGDSTVAIEVPKRADGESLLVRFERPGRVVLKPGEELELKARVTPLKDPVYGRAVITTSSSEMPSFEIAFYGTIRGNQASGKGSEKK